MASRVLWTAVEVVSDPATLVFFRFDCAVMIHGSTYNAMTISASTWCLDTPLSKYELSMSYLPSVPVLSSALTAAWTIYGHVSLAYPHHQRINLPPLNDQYQIDPSAWVQEEIPGKVVWSSSAPGCSIPESRKNIDTPYFLAQPLSKNHTCRCRRRRSPVVYQGRSW